MNVGIVAFHSQVGAAGGTSVYTRSLVEALADHAPQHSYTVLVAESRMDDWSYRPWPQHVRFVSLSQVEPQQPLSVRAWRQLCRVAGLPVPPHYGGAYLSRQIDELGLDVLHFPRTVIQPLAVQTPAVLTFFDMQHEFYPQFFTQGELERRAQTYRPSVEKARHVIAPSQHTRQTLLERYGTPESKVTLVPVGLPDSFCRPSPSEIEAVIAQYRLPETFVYYPANPWPHKNHARLMAALRVYGERYGHVPWLVLSGRLRGEPRDAGLLAVAAGVSERVLDLGFVPYEDLPGLYSAASALVFPSLFEGFGIPLIEAMACGCPIAAAKAASIPEVAGGAALLFDPLSPEAIADAVHTVLEDQDLRTDLAARGHRQVELFGWKVIAPRLARIYEEAGR